MGTTTPNDFRLMTNNSTKMTIISNGRVCVGTTTPSAALHVTGATTYIIGSANRDGFSMELQCSDKFLFLPRIGALQRY